ncbi:hypothetical protein ACHWQZ_G015560 [Mnemiopsis leidyi]
MTWCVTPRQVTNLLNPLLAPSPDKTSSSPRSRDNPYRQLLSSYSSYDWCNKPLPLSPLQCAKWGWQSAGKDILQCRLCKVKIHFVCAFQPWQNTQYDKICKEFGIQVQTAHLPACPWSNKPLSDDIVFGGRTSLIYDKSDFVNTFFDLLKTFATEKIPAIEAPGNALKKVWPVLSVILKSVKNRRPAEFRDNELSLTVGNVSLILLSLFGWRKSDDTLPTIHCKLCLRTLGLWNFRCLDSEITSTVIDVEDNQCSWDEGRSYLLYPLDGSSTTTSRSRELSSASEVSHSFPSGDSTVQNSPEKDESERSPPQLDDTSCSGNNESGDAEMISVPDGESVTEESTVNPTNETSNDVATTADNISKRAEVYAVKQGDEVVKYENSGFGQSVEKAVKTEDSPGEPTSKLGEIKGNDSSKDEPSELKDPVKFGNPDIFLPVASYVLFQPRTTEADVSDNTKSESPEKECDDKKVEEEVDDSPPSRSTRSRTGASPSKKFKTPQSKTPKTRVLRSRSKVSSSETPPSPRASGSRKRKTMTLETTPGGRSTRLTRSASAGNSPCVTPPPLQPTRKRRKSKLELTANLVSELMNSSLTQLDLSASNPSNLDVIKQHHYWCPWVSTLPSYHINKVYRNTPTRLADQGHTKVNIVDQTDSTGWETLLFHLSTVKSPGNAWIAVHNMLEDCVSQRK